MRYYIKFWLFAKAKTPQSFSLENNFHFNRWGDKNHFKASKIKFPCGTYKNGSCGILHVGTNIAFLVDDDVGKIKKVFFSITITKLETCPH